MSQISKPSLSNSPETDLEKIIAMGEALREKIERASHPQAKDCEDLKNLGNSCYCQWISISPGSKNATKISGWFSLLQRLAGQRAAYQRVRQTSEETNQKISGIKPFDKLQRPRKTQRIVPLAQEQTEENVPKSWDAIKVGRVLETVQGIVNAKEAWFFPDRYKGFSKIVETMAAAGTRDAFDRSMIELGKLCVKETIPMDVLRVLLTIIFTYRNLPDKDRDDLMTNFFQRFYDPVSDEEEEIVENLEEYLKKVGENRSGSRHDK